jgi:hypothetical protein
MNNRLKRIVVAGTTNGVYGGIVGVIVKAVGGPTWAAVGFAMVVGVIGVVKV